MENLEERTEVNPLKDRKYTKIPDKEKLAEAEPDEKIESIMKQFKSLELYQILEGESDVIEEFDMDVLSPIKIELLAYNITTKTSKRRLKGKMPGFLLSKVIQDSYDNGYNDFKIDTRNIPLERIGDNLKGTKENPIKITIHGSNLDLLGTFSEYCVFYIKGNTGGSCGFDSKNNEFNIEGNTEYFTGSKSKNCKFRLKGAKESCGSKAENSIFEIEGDVGMRLGKGAKRCTFMTHNSKTYGQIKKHTSLLGRIINRNKIRYIE